MAHSLELMAENILEIINKILKKVMVKCTGQMVKFIKEIGYKDKLMIKELLFSQMEINFI